MLKLVIVICISSVWITSGSIISFGWDNPNVLSTSKETTPKFSSSTSSSSASSSTSTLSSTANTEPSPTTKFVDPNCGCVLPNRCAAQPGIDGPRKDEQSKGLRFEFISSNYSRFSSDTRETYSSSSNRIVNKCPVSGEIWCCNIIPPKKPEPEPDRCGQSNIIPVPGYPDVPGQASFGKYPWMAIIISTQDTMIGMGVLIDPQNVLTVAHSLTNSPSSVGRIRFGEWNISNELEPHKIVDVSVKWFQLHEDFNDLSLKNDIAIIRLEKPLKLTKADFPHINTACLPKPEETFTDRRCWVAGYGKDAYGKFGESSSIPREVQVPVVSGDSCEKQLRTSDLGGYFDLDKKSFICAGGERHKDACTGDGGSGLMCPGSDGRVVVAGLVSWGMGCAKFPGVYVNVANYISWINNVLAH